MGLRYAAFCLSLPTGRRKHPSLEGHACIRMQKRRREKNLGATSRSSTRPGVTHVNQGLLICAGHIYALVDVLDARPD